MVICAPLVAVFLLSGCSPNGDFGRVRPSLVVDSIHDWVGVEAAQAHGAPVSQYPLTDDERLLRDLAYPLIDPPFTRQRWYSVIAEYGITGKLGLSTYATSAYADHLTRTRTRSSNTRYAKLTEDIRNDIERIDPFFAVARRVLDIDQKRELSLAYISPLSHAEKKNALARNNENALVVRWVHRSLVERANAYQFALERLVIGTPSPMAVDAERSLTLMNAQIAEYAPIKSAAYALEKAASGPYVSPRASNGAPVSK